MMELGIGINPQFFCVKSFESALLLCKKIAAGAAWTANSSRTCENDGYNITVILSEQKKP